jgi:antitoxin component YwqK of YwqJK toxin-antitoxin module
MRILKQFYCLVCGLSIILFAQICFAQNGKDKSLSKGEIINGLKEGEWLFYYPDGKIMAKELYKNDELNGKSFSYYPNGLLSGIEYWVDDLQEDSAFYFHPNGKLNRKGRYEKGVYQGIWLTFFENEVLNQLVYYVDGLPDGKSKNWFSSGLIEEEGSYRFGKKDGQFISYFEKKGSPIRLISNYLDDKEAGVWIFFTKKGKMDHFDRF